MELDIGVHATRLAGRITFTSTESDAVFLILAHLPGFVKDDIAVSLNESRTEIKINGDKGKSYLIETEVSQRVRISHEVSIQGFSEEFLIPGGVDLDRIDVGFEEEEAILVITIPKVERQEQEVALGIGKDIPLDLQETGTCGKELEGDCENLEHDLVEREIETIREITEPDEIEIITDLEVIEINKEEPNLELEINHEDPKTESEINLDNPETVSDIKLEDPKLQPEIKPEERKSDSEIIPECPETELEINQEVLDPDIEIKQDIPELELQTNEESKPEENIEEIDSKNNENEINDQEIEIMRQNPDELKPETTENPRERGTETKAKEKEDGIEHPEYLTPCPNPDLSKPIEKCEPDHDEQQDQVGPSITIPPSEFDPDSKAKEKENGIAEDPEHSTSGPNQYLPKPIEKCEPNQDEQQDQVGPSITASPSEFDPDSKAQEKENGIAEDPEHSTPGPNQDLPKPIEKCEPNQDEQQDQVGPSITASPTEFDPDSKAKEKEDGIAEDPKYSTPGPNRDLPKPIEKCEPNQDEQQDQVGPSITPPSEFDPDSKAKEKEDGIAEDPKYSTPGPNRDLPKPIEKCEPDQDEQQDQVGPSITAPPSEFDPDSKAKEKEDGIAEDPKYSTPEPNRDLPKPIEKCEPDQDEQQDQVGPSITAPPSEFDLDSKAQEKENGIAEDPEHSTPGPNQDLPKPIEKCEPDHDKQQDQVSPSITTQPSECDPDSKAKAKKDWIAEDPKHSTLGPNQDLPKPIEKCEPDQDEQQDQVGPSIKSPPSECDPDSTKLIEKLSQTTVNNTFKKTHLFPPQDQILSQTLDNQLIETNRIRMNNFKKTSLQCIQCQILNQVHQNQFREVKPVLKKNKLDQIKRVKLPVKKQKTKQN